MAIERILITVKTYPAISSTYDELVCTAGLREDGSWIRLFPIQYRQIDNFEKRYKKWDLIEIDIEKNRSDHRPESHRPINQDSIKIIKSIGTEQNWFERKQIVLEKGTIYYDLEELISLNKAGQLSLATFKPSKIISVDVEEDEREWDSKKLTAIEQKSKQIDLFNENTKKFKIVNKIPYKFFYRIEDVNGKQSRMMIEDWELGALFWNCLKAHKDEKTAIEKVKEKFFDEFTEKKDLHLFLGTTLLWDKRAPNPFVVIGAFFPPLERQQALF